MIEISRVGLATALGNNYVQSCAAIRAGIAAFAETAWVLADGPVIAAPARHVTGDATGGCLLAHLAAAAVQDAEAEPELATAPVFLALRARGQPGFSEDIASITLRRMQSVLRVDCHTRTEVIEAGPVSTFVALAKARQLLMRQGVNTCVIVAVDSLVNGACLMHLARNGRLKTPTNPDGLVPGEAGACLVVSRRHVGSSGLWVRGLGFGIERAVSDSGEPILGRGLGSAMKAALDDAACTMADIDFRMSDVTGERSGFMDANYAIGRVLRIRKPTLELLHLMDTLGTIGAAAGACQLAYLKFAYAKGCVPSGSAFCETSSDDGRRAVAVVGGASPSRV